ncbi:Hypothetical predicted protein [Mytilus galloprovincialis]|uniref:Uncharacterized protein n=1 Tax=Mytilus galloprovincialis TaxID=29158 RepID=A0A8B6G3S0_MYTGA|nr:Hypothetical predicted protein [Mytilus galloprovincialis]
MMKRKGIEDEATSKKLLTKDKKLQNGKLHGKVMKMITELVNDGMDHEKAIKVAIRKYKPMLESFQDEAIDNETNIDGSESENSIDGDEEEEEEDEDDEKDESSTI